MKNKLLLAASLRPLPAGEIDQAFIQTYESTLRHLAQQKYSKLKGKCQHVNEQSESHNWETLDSMREGEVTRKKGRTPSADGTFPTPTNAKRFNKRKTNIDTYDTGHSTEQEDISQMLIDPNSNLVMSQAMAMGRKVDDLVIAGMWKDAFSKNGTAIPFLDADDTTDPSYTLFSQKLGDGTKPISFDFVTEITEAFLERDIEADEGKCIVIGPTQARKLLQITEATSADYGMVQTLNSFGIAENWMGYTWIVSTRLKYWTSAAATENEWAVTSDTPFPAAGEIFCAAMTMKALGYHTSKDIWTRVGEDVSASFAWRIYSAFSADCTRIEDEHIFKLHLLDSL